MHFGKSSIWKAFCLSLAISFALIQYTSHPASAKTIMDEIGTGATGSYPPADKPSEGSGTRVIPKKPEGSKSKKGPHGKGHHAYKKHGSDEAKKCKGKKESKKCKGEGSGSRKYSHGQGYKGHGKSEGSGAKKYSHGQGYKGHGKSGHGSGYSKHGSSRGHHRGGHKTSPFKHILKFSKALGLTDSQIDEMQSMELQYKKQRIMLKAQHEIAHLELDKLVHAVTIDENRIRQLADEIATIKSKKIHSMAESKIAVLKLLSLEQRKKVNQMHSGH